MLVGCRESLTRILYLLIRIFYSWNAIFKYSNQVVPDCAVHTYMQINWCVFCFCELDFPFRWSVWNFPYGSHHQLTVIIWWREKHHTQCFKNAQKPKMVQDFLWAQFFTSKHNEIWRFLYYTTNLVYIYCHWSSLPTYIIMIFHVKMCVCFFTIPNKNVHRICGAFSLSSSQTGIWLKDCKWTQASQQAHQTFFLLHLVLRRSNTNLSMPFGPGERTFVQRKAISLTQ